MKKVLVCGTGFGQYYLKALASMKGEVELAGILSRGSSQSARWADRLGVPLYTDLSQLDSVEIDIACVVVKSEIVGGSGSDLVGYFLNRGIHVFQEHPVHYDRYGASVKLARKEGCCYFMNTFYPFLRSVNVFLKTLEQLRKDTPINYIRAECGIQVLFPMLDMLGRAAGGKGSFRLDPCKEGESQQPFAVIRGQIDRIPFLLLVKNEMDVQHVESNIALLHQMNVNTAHGNLTLTDVHGQVIWTPVIHEDLKGEDSSTFGSISLQQSLMEGPSFTMEDIFDVLWPGSIRRSLRWFIDMVDRKASFAGVHQYYLSICRTWNTIGTMLGNYQPVTCQVAGPVELKAVGEMEP